MREAQTELDVAHQTAESAQRPRALGGEDPSRRQCHRLSLPARGCSGAPPARTAERGRPARRRDWESMRIRAQAGAPTSSPAGRRNHAQQPGGVGPATGVVPSRQQAGRADSHHGRAGQGRQGWHWQDHAPAGLTTSSARSDESTAETPAGVLLHALAADRSPLLRAITAHANLNRAAHASPPVKQEMLMQMMLPACMDVAWASVPATRPLSLKAAMLQNEHPGGATKLHALAYADSPARRRHAGSNHSDAGRRWPGAINSGALGGFMQAPCTPPGVAPAGREAGRR